MPNTGKLADPAFRSARARKAALARHSTPALVAQIGARDDLTDEDRAALRRIAEAAPAPTVAQIETLRPILSQER